MPRKPNWDALGKLFAPTKDASASASDADTVFYLGEPMQKWLARDLFQERAAIYEFCDGMPRPKAEALARSELKYPGKD